MLSESSAIFVAQAAVAIACPSNEDAALATDLGHIRPLTFVACHRWYCGHSPLHIGIAIVNPAVKIHDLSGRCSIIAAVAPPKEPAGYLWPPFVPITPCPITKITKLFELQGTCKSRFDAQVEDAHRLIHRAKSEPSRRFDTTLRALSSQNQCKAGRNVVAWTRRTSYSSIFACSHDGCNGPFPVWRPANRRHSRAEPVGSCCKAAKTRFRRIVHCWSSVARVLSVCHDCPLKICSDDIG